jgi:hypothetical protein
VKFIIEVLDETRQSPDLEHGRIYTAVCDESAVSAEGHSKKEAMLHAIDRLRWKLEHEHPAQSFDNAL